MFTGASTGALRISGGSRPIYSQMSADASAGVTNYSMLAQGGATNVQMQKPWFLQKVQSPETKIVLGDGIGRYGRYLAHLQRIAMHGTPVRGGDLPVTDWTSDAYETRTFWCRHGGYFSALFFDGHVERVAPIAPESRTPAQVKAAGDRTDLWMFCPYRDNQGNGPRQIERTWSSTLQSYYGPYRMVYDMTNR